MFVSLKGGIIRESIISIKKKKVRRMKNRKNYFYRKNKRRIQPIELKIEHIRVEFKRKSSKQPLFEDVFIDYF